MSPFASLYRLRVGDWGWWDGMKMLPFSLVGGSGGSANDWEKGRLDSRGWRILSFRQVVAAALMYCMDYEI